MKKINLAVLLALAISMQTAHAQYWKTTGNSISSSNFLGTTNCYDLTFKTNGIERGRLTSAGIWRFGTSTNNAQISASGNLTFNGTAAYNVGGNKYVFRYTGNPNYGLYFNSSVPQYEFRNGSATPVFYVNANNGNGAFNGTLKVGAYTLPSTDGASGQVLKTNGTGALSWSNDNGGSYTAGTGIGISGNVISNTGDPDGTDDANRFLSNLLSPTAVNQSLLPDVTNTRDFGSGSVAWKDIYFNGALYLNGERYLSNPSPGTGNILLGPGALASITSGHNNVAVGTNALLNNTTGINNTATGFVALAANTTGTDNSASGFIALTNNTTGTRNTANGSFSLVNNTIGSYNTAIGMQTLVNNTSGNSNTASGTYALDFNSSGSFNTAYGSGALYNNTTGSNNTAVGHSALSSNKTGITLTSIGENTDVASDGLNNATAVGYGAIVDASDKVRIGNTAVTSIGGEVGWTTFSDGRYKRNIKENVRGLAFINNLRPVTYTVDINDLNGYFNKGRKTLAEKSDIKEDAAKLKGLLPAVPPVVINAKEDEYAKKSANEASRIIQTGFIAQEVEAAAQKLNYDFSGVDKPKTKDGLYGLRYDEFVVPLVKAVQELSKMNDAKDAKIDDLEKRLNKLETMLLQSSSSQNIVLSGNDAASLQQNIPNPFANTTVINYTLPPKFSSAQIIITDKNGRILKQVRVEGSGKGVLNIDASTLASGGYNYSLYVDGKLLGSRQMILTK